ncbi:MAG: DNA polymerase III subunit [Planctomycetales bacterium]|nr:DNA polymerase III subunit [Planctomycetales bacterium]
MWQNIRGHDQTVEWFRARIAAGRLASTYLFIGPDGIGKRLFARKLAAALLCTSSEPVAMEPCGNCEACQTVASGNHPDVDEVGLPEGKKTLPIELFIGDREHRNREGLCHNIALRPLSGRRRVAIIDDADWLSVESANCLLKTLEEPPPGAVIILIGTSRSRQLPTILSRTQLVRFSPLPTPDLAALLEQQGVALGAEAQELAQRAGGSLALAREMSDPTLAQLATRLARHAEQGDLAIAQFAAEINELVNAAGSEAQVRRGRIRQVATLAAGSLRERLRAACTDEPQLDADRLVSLIERCLDVETHVDRNDNQALVIESWLDAMAGV